MSDSINRQDAIDALIPIVKSASLRNRNVYSMARKCLGAIEDVPSAECTGEWLPHKLPSGRDSIDTDTCSECGYIDSLSWEHNYCPNCGARMRGEEDVD